MTKRSPALIAGAISVLAVFLISGCSSPRYAVQHPTFDSAGVGDVAIVMSKSAWRVKGDFRPVEDDIAQTLDERVIALLQHRAAFFGSSVTALELEASAEALAAAETAYGQVLDQAQTLLHQVQQIHVPVPPELAALGGDSNVRHYMVVRTVGWHSGPGAQAGTVVAAVAASLLVPGVIFIPTGTSYGTGVEVLLIDAESSVVAWYGQQYADLDPRREEHLDAVVTALVMQLYTGQRVEARDLTRWPIGQHVSAWLHGGGRVSGHLEGREGLEVFLRQRDGSTESVFLTEVRSIRPSTGGRIFPAQRVAKVPRRLF